MKRVSEKISAPGASEVVTDKGYHSNDTLTALAEANLSNLHFGTGSWTASLAE